MFKESGELQQFLQCYRMDIETCLKTFAMMEACQHSCSEQDINTFGLANGCKAGCAQAMTRTLSAAERHVILFSMIYVVDETELKPNVRE